MARDRIRTEGVVVSRPYPHGYQPPPLRVEQPVEVEAPEVERLLRDIKHDLGFIAFWFKLLFVVILVGLMLMCGGVLFGVYMVFVRQ